MTSPDRRQHVIDTFSKHLREHGDGAQAVGWGSDASQAKRFSVLAQIGDIQGVSILDVGCGLGHFFRWLKANELSVDYTGLDITPEMVTRARAEHPDGVFENGSVEDVVSSGVARFDYVFASGIFYLDVDGGYEAMAATLRAMFALSNNGVAFNTLSTWADQRDAGEFYADPAETLSLCREITRWVRLRHDYHPADFTCYLYRQAL